MKRLITAAMLGLGIGAAASPHAMAAFPAVFELADLDGSNGFLLKGIKAYDRSGGSVSAAGDINGDGRADLLIGARGADAAYVVFGRDTATDGEFRAKNELSALDGSNGFVLSGPDMPFLAVSDAGDINGDGLADLLICSADLEGRGQTYVVFGRDTAVAGDFPATVELSSLNGRDGFIVNGEGSGTALSGWSASSAGDINGDGHDDLLLGAPGASRPNWGNTGVSYVVFGRDTATDGDFPAAFELSALNGSNGFKLYGARNGDKAGYSVSGAGDVNGDGIADLLVGAIHADTNGRWAGASYVVFGRDTVARGDFPAAIRLSALNGRNGFVLNGVHEYDNAGWSVSGAGDINGDGVADILIGAPEGGPNNFPSGAIYVVFGRRTATEGDFLATVELSALDGRNGFVLYGERSGEAAGNSVSGLRDINGDGFADVLVGAPNAYSNAKPVGAGYVLFGRNTAADGDFPAAIRLADLNGQDGFILHGIDENDLTGHSVSNAGDIDGDGAEDLLIGAPGARPHWVDSGESYVVFGQASPSLATPMVRCPGDVDGDGVVDVIMIRPDGSAVVRSLNDQPVSQFSFSAVSQSIDAVIAPDMNRNGSAELAVLGAATAEIRDSLTGAQVSLLTFDPVDTTVDLELFDSGSDEPHLVSLDRGLVQAQIRTTIGSALISNTLFSKYLDVLDLETYPDLNSDSVPELAVLATHDGADKGDKLEIRAPDTGDIIREIYLNRDWRALQHEWVKDTNGNGYPEAVILRTHHIDQRHQVVLRDTSPAKQHVGFIQLDGNYPPLRLLTITDINGNGSDEVIVFGQRFNGGNQKAQVKDSKTRKRINAVFFDKNFAGQDIAACPDINSNGTDELVMLGLRARDGKLRAIVKDALTSELIGKIDFN